MITYRERPRPESWLKYRTRIQSGWLWPLLALDWLFNWLAHYLSRWVLIEVLEYVGKFSILIAVIFYFAESGDRTKQKHYQAWQVINTAQGKGGSGGRIEALQELNADRVPLVGIDLTDSFLMGVRLDHADLARSSFGSADLRNASLRNAKLPYANLITANLRDSDLHGADLRFANLTNADLVNADLSQANLNGIQLDNADLGNANLAGVRWQGIASMKQANVFGVKGVQANFRVWALGKGAVSEQGDDRRK